MAEEHIRTPQDPPSSPQIQPEEMRREGQIQAEEKRKEPPPAPTVAQQEKPPVVKDSFREIVETVVFVIVLVLLLKTFVAEAFVIPTGSMAPTLYGNHLDVPCPKCGWNFAV